VVTDYFVGAELATPFENYCGSVIVALFVSSLGVKFAATKAIEKNCQHMEYADESFFLYLIYYFHFLLTPLNYVLLS